MQEGSGRRPMTPEDLWKMRRVGAPASDDRGNRIVVPVTTYDLEDNRGTTRLYLLDGRSEPRALTSPEASCTAPAVSPDGTRLALVRTEPGKKGQIAVLSLLGGEAEVVTDLPLGAADPRWFPDGRRIAFLAWVLRDAPTPEGTRDLLAAREKDPVRAHVTEDRIYRHWDTWLTDGKVPHLFVLDLETRDLLDLIPDSGRWFEFMDPSGQFDISPDGEEVAFSADASLPPHSPTNWDVFTVPARGGEVRNLTAQNPADDVRPRYSPDGRWILYGMQRMNDFYADRVRLAAYDRKHDRHRVLTEDWDRSAADWEFMPGRDTVFLTAEDEGRVVIFRTGLEEGEPKRVRTGGAYGGLRPLAGGGLLAVRNTLSDPPEVVRLDTAGSHEERLTRMNDDRVNRLALGEVSEIQFPGADGVTIQAWLVLPPGFDSSRKWPLVEVLHGGPHGITGDQFHFRWNLQLIAASGYVVVAPNFHGSTGRGQDFAASIHGGWGDKPYTDAMAAVDAVVAEGYVDPARMAAVGASYGGYLVAWIAGRTDRFACIVNHAGVADTLAEYGSDVTYGRERSMGGQPWDGLEKMDRMNPIRFAAGFKTPMLVSHGDRDYRVPVNQGMALYNVLQAKGVPSRLVHFPDENHWVLKPQNALLWHREFRAWLDRWIGPAASR